MKRELVLLYVYLSIILNHPQVLDRSVRVRKILCLKMMATVANIIVQAGNLFVQKLSNAFHFGGNVMSRMIVVIEAMNQPLALRLNVVLANFNAGVRSMIA